MAVSSALLLASAFLVWSSFVFFMTLIVWLEPGLVWFSSVVLMTSEVWLVSVELAWFSEASVALVACFSVLLGLVEDFWEPATCFPY